MWTGIVVTGTLDAVSNPAKVSIAAGATVYLADATINNTVECLGDGTCQDITIQGGTVTAQAVDYGAGIGTGLKYSSSSYPRPTCGNITISGGTITATRGASAVWDIGPGVVSGYQGTYDGVVNGTISVTVTVKDKNGNDASIYAVAP
ncbi:MAG: hypothetical protein K6D91_05385 [Prevotella sp.]|nr:hypothetical protein [Prevotella sp.]